MKEMIVRAREIWTKHGRDIGLFVGFVLVGAVGFEAGLIEGQSRQSKPLLVAAPATPGVAQASCAVDTTATIAANPSSSASSSDAPAEKCVFVGSKNSTKYHAPNCSFAKRIKPENRVCFASKEDAEGRGYTPGCLK